MIDLWSPTDNTNLLNSFESIWQQMEQIPATSYYKLQFFYHPNNDQNKFNIHKLQNRERERERGRERTSSCPARLTFSFWKSDVSKSSEAGSLVAGGADTIRAARDEATMLVRRWRVRVLKGSWEEEDWSVRLLVVMKVLGWRIWEVEEIDGENDVVAAIVGRRRK